MIFHIKGTVVGVLDRGFLLHTGGGEPITVTTQTAGCDLGLNPGDAVEALGGPVGQSTFASSTAFKVLPSGKSIEIPVNTWRTPRQEPDQPRAQARHGAAISANQLRNHGVPSSVTTSVVSHPPMNTSAYPTAFSPAEPGCEGWMHRIRACVPRHAGINTAMSGTMTRRLP